MKGPWTAPSGPRPHPPGEHDRGRKATGPQEDSVAFTTNFHCVIYLGEEVCRRIAPQLCVRVCQHPQPVLEGPGSNTSPLDYLSGPC